MTTKLLLAIEAVFILGLVCVAILASPWLLWKWLTEPRLWREPVRPARGGYYDHP